MINQYKKRSLIGIIIGTFTVLLNVACIVGALAFMIRKRLEPLIEGSKTEICQLKIADNGTLTQEESLTKQQGYALSTFICSIIISVCSMMTMVATSLIVGIIKHRPILMLPFLSVSSFAVFCCLIRTLTFATFGRHIGITPHGQLVLLLTSLIEMTLEVSIIYVVLTLYRDSKPKDNAIRLRVIPNRKTARSKKNNITKC